MRKALLAVLYGAALMVANAAHADVAAAAALRDGDMVKLQFHDAPQPLTLTAFQSFEGAPLDLSDWQGKHVLVNFWATWCVPCRKEMPALSRLQADMGGDDFEVLTIQAGRDKLVKMEKFLKSIDATNLPLHRDPRMELMRSMGGSGLPFTVILNPEGQMIAALSGDAEWDASEAKALIAALVDEHRP